MPEINAFPETGYFFKGNLHTHSTVSDGSSSPEELVAGYKANGYDFLAITDHCVYSDYSEYSSPDFLMLPGVELHTDQPGCGAGAATCHIVGIGRPENTFMHKEKIVYDTKTVSPQALASLLRSHGNIAVLAHPYWSGTTTECLDSFDLNDGFEIFNTLCEYDFGTGYSEYVFEHYLKRRRRAFAFANDDLHSSIDGAAGIRNRAFIGVKAPALTHKDIITAIDSGFFYASNGPQIYDFRVSGNTAYIKCSPANKISLRGIALGRTKNCSDGSMTEAEFSISGNEEFLRAVINDGKGGTAWTQAIYLK